MQRSGVFATCGIGCLVIGNNTDYLTGKYCPWYYVDENRWAVLHEYITSAAVDQKNLYRVQVGAFSSRENAEQYMNKVKAAGFGAFIVEVDNNA